MEIKQIIYKSKEYSEELELRNRVLRIPLGLSIYDDNLAAEKNDFHYGVYENDVLIAVFILSAKPDNLLKMRQVAVEENRQKLGIGMQMVRFTEDFARKNNFKQVVLHARKSAVDFYKKQDYEVVGSEFTEVNIPHFFMQKEIDPSDKQIHSVNDNKRNEIIILKTADFVKSTLEFTEAGHNWWHSYRVWQLSKRIARIEHANNLVVELGALLHDIADVKFHYGNEEIGPRKAREFLLSLEVEEVVIQHVEKIITNISFAGGNFEQTFKSVELDIVQDADRLDAMGAIGIARTFNYGGFKNREMYNPAIEPNLNMTKEEYRKSSAPTINHFYEKLLVLKDRMNTKTAIEMAQQRHEFMELFLNEFYAEWEGEK